ncbi:MAG: penicillin-binding protein [Candidatus Peribacteraceae bacterium]|nr:penicillin-binding protein [Candidatus Peribacteraceae bacterium]MDD5742808.1 penicillin-binding protein [Candidatus Peribacteraceae bacterium]
MVPEFELRSLSNGRAASRPSARRLPSASGGGFLGAPLRFFRGLLRIFLPPSGTHKRFRRFVLRAGLFFVIAGVLYLTYLWFTLPDISDPKSLFAPQSTVITDRNGIELYRLFNEQDRTFVPGAQIPDSMKNAIIAIEDQRFYDRGCLDVRAMVRVVVQLGQAGGGSTLTRQLARNALDLKQENIVSRKFKEVILGCQMESKFSKNQLLELYLNWIPFGQNAYGIEQASRTYFARSASGLTLAQSAVLAALPQRPSYFNPYGSHVHTKVSGEIVRKILDGTITSAAAIPDEDVTIGLLGAHIGTGATTIYIGGRADAVLKRMQELSMITEQQQLQALDDLETLTFQPMRDTIRAPHFVLWVRDQVEQLLGGQSEKGILERGGLKVTTTLDWRLQEIAEKIVANHREDILNRFGAHNIALVALDPQTRDVLAYVGNTDYSDEKDGGKIDMVQAPRQPGSSFKPIVYAAAFQQGYTPATILYDVTTKIGDDQPQDFDGKEMGLLTIRQALGASRNIPAAKAFFLAGGEQPILELARDLGAPAPLQRRNALAAPSGSGSFEYGWPLALGAAETPLMEMAEAYASIGDGGMYKPVVSILKVEDRKGALLYAPERGKDERQVLDPRIAYQITSILSDVSVRPSDYWKTQLSVAGYASAAKTGTSNKCLEWQDKNTCKLRKPDNAWVLGYTPGLVAGVWSGNANSSAMYENGGGLNTSSPVWKEFMDRAHRILVPAQKEFMPPPGIIQPQISMLSGELPTACTPIQFRRADVFLEERPPLLQDPACAQLVVDKVTHLLASDACPQEAQESGSFLVAKSILADRWPTWEEGVQTWVRQQMDLWYATPDHSGSILPLPVAPTAKCDPSLTPGRLDQPTLTILSPDQNGSVTYPAFRPRLSYRVGSPVREIRFAIDGKRVAVRTAAPFDEPLRVPRSINEDGLHRFEVTLIDEYYNTVTSTVSFRFGEGGTGISITFSEPGGDTSIALGESLSMRADVRDQDGALKYVQFYLDDLLLTTKPKEPFALTYGVTVSPGTYRLRAVATDLTGKTTEDSLSLTVTAKQ